MKVGPPIQELTAHLAECPEIFLAEPLQPNGAGELDLKAVVADLLRALGKSDVGKSEVHPFGYSNLRSVQSERNRLRLIGVACWLCWQEDVRRHFHCNKALKWLSEGLEELARLVPADQFVRDPERREELSRLVLAAQEMVPMGESVKEAENKLDALSTVKRDRVVRESRAAEERARKLREEMARKAAQATAASNWNHE